MLGHSLEGLPWDGVAMSGSLPFCDDDDDMRMMLDGSTQDVNNRVGGGAGKRLSLQELQVCSTSLYMSEKFTPFHSPEIA